MSNRRRFSLVLLAAILFLGLRPGNSSAFFERFFVSSRAFSLGGAFAGVADDPSAVVLNAAGMTQIQTTSILSSATQPYGIDGLAEYFVAVAVPTRIGAVGVSWHRFGLENVTSEDLITFAYARDYIRTSQDASLSFGASLDLARVSFDDTYVVSKTVVTGAASMLLRPFPVIGIGYTVRNIGQPSFDLVPGGGKTTLGVTHNLGVAYHMRRQYVFLYERERGQDGRWRDRFGIEIRALDNLQFRTGIKDKNVTGGLGVRVSGVTVDVGVSSHSDIGLSYLLSLGFALPTKNSEVGNP